jgi:hypothetical protein
MTTFICHEYNAHFGWEEDGDYQVYSADKHYTVEAETKEEAEWLFYRLIDFTTFIPIEVLEHYQPCIDMEGGFEIFLEEYNPSKEYEFEIIPLSAADLDSEEFEYVEIN